MAGRRPEEERAAVRQGVITLKEVKQHPAIDAYLRQADIHLAAMGFTEHGHRHCGLVASIAGNILRRLGRPQRVVELARSRATPTTWGIASAGTATGSRARCWWGGSWKRWACPTRRSG